MIRFLLFSFVWSFLMVFAVTYGQLHQWPDFVHFRYGFPLTYAVHTVNTIAGPSDFWVVDMSLLAADLVIWLSGYVIGSFLILFHQRMKTGQ